MREKLDELKKQIFFSVSAHMYTHENLDIVKFSAFLVVLRKMQNFQLLLSDRQWRNRE